MSALLFLVFIVVWVIGFVDAIMADADRVRALPKAVWVILILLFNIFGAIAWFIFGRPRGEESAGGVAGILRSWSANGPPVERPSRTKTDTSDPTGWQLGGAGGRKRTGPVAPDDDPEFLRGLGKRRPEDPS